MENKLKNLLDLAKPLPENRPDMAIEKLTEIKRESDGKAGFGMPEMRREVRCP
jgi:hypothetical protein